MTHTLYKMCSRVRRAVRTHRRAVVPMRLHTVYKVCAGNLGCGDMGGEAGRAASMMPPSKQTGSFIETALPANGGFEITACDGATERNTVYKVCAGNIEYEGCGNRNAVYKVCADNLGREGCGEGPNDAATQSLIADADEILRILVSSIKTAKMNNSTIPNSNFYILMNLPLLRSLLTTENPFNSTDAILAWIAQRNREVEVRVEQTPFAAMKGWGFDPSTGNLVHESGKFFSIVGLDVMTNVGTVARWTQPVINQPEVGYLGIIVKEMDGVLYFLLQAKIEPGNVNCVQLSPTLQATRSNYTCVHGGKKPAYLDYFKNATPDQIVLDQLQSEQGARFYRKRNRNIIIRVDDDLTLGPDFRWLTLGQIKALIAHDNTVNMDTRTVLSGLRFVDTALPSALPPSSLLLSPFTSDLFISELLYSGVLTIDQILHRLSELKSRYELVVDKIPLSRVSSDWQVTPTEIVRTDRRYFRILGVNVTIANREVATWCQPIVEPMQEGLCVLVAKKINGVLHFLLQAKVECGNFDVVEFAPTIQCLTGDYRSVSSSDRPTFVREFTDSSLPGRIVFDTRQSEEGGRFYHEQNRNVLFLLNDDAALDTPENFLWLTLGQIKEFLRYNNYLNIQVRSLVSALIYLETSSPCSSCSTRLNK